MDERSRIKFNPITSEVEIEGTEDFVKNYFSKIQKLLSNAGQTAKAGRPVKAIGAARRTGKAALKLPGEKSGKRKSNFDTVLELIAENPEGINTADLKQRTGLSEQQIWGIIYRAEKVGKIKKVKRGVYVSA
ncbi:MAG: type IV toxin-antitoxin system AbiEi family antitoxin domain-containing protein [Deltaproteobacteria bacterium]|nr:type IV toxin-antitoxin system AbiEi family antitoxin domain-containing protein [Deltaproteobacteria bacterium]